MAHPLPTPDPCWTQPHSSRVAHSSFIHSPFVRSRLPAVCHLLAPGTVPPGTGAALTAHAPSARCSRGGRSGDEPRAFPAPEPSPALQPGVARWRQLDVRVKQHFTVSRVPVAVHCAQLRPPAQGRDWGRGWGAHGPADTTQAWPGVGIATRPETAPRLLAGGRLVAEPDRSPALLLRGEHAGLRPGHPGSQRTDLDEGSAPGVQQRPGPAAAARRLCGHGACARRVLSSCHLCVQGPDGPRKPPWLAQGRLDKCLLSQAGARLLLHMCLPCVARNRRLMAGVGCYARSHPQPIKSGERQ